MIVLITTDRRPGLGHHDSPRVRPRRDESFVNEAYVHAVRAAGGVPLLVAPGEADLDELLSIADAVVITGGNLDIHPHHYGALVAARLDTPDERRTQSELALARRCIQDGVPVLGVCGGMQALAVAAGGTLIQDIHTLVPDALEHEQPTDPAEGWHSLRVESSALRLVLGRAPVVNSTHHQAVDDPGPFRPVAWAPDGVIEAMELPGHPFCTGVQWHPELLGVQPYALMVDVARALGRRGR
jgi:putative glutamine amidotransferase